MDDNNDNDDWRQYDPSDLRTHPEELTDIEIKFSDGSRGCAVYSRAAGGISVDGNVPLPDTTGMKWRWRYKPPLGR